MEDAKIQKLNIENKIYIIRGKEVMLDSDLAILYQCVNGTKTINQAISRHMDKFPSDFYFQLTKEEYENLKSQTGTSSWNNYGGVRKLPHVFTEEGVAMLASVLRTSIASEISVKIMRAFVKMRHYLIDNKDIYKSLNNINNTLIEHDEKLDYLFSKFDKKEYLFLENTEYDAYSNILDILSLAKNSITIIDPYVDKSFLDTIRNLNKKVILITKNNSKLTKTEIDKYNKEYNNLTIIYSTSFHDRYIILDSKDIYHLGASINHAGSKVFSIHLIEDKDIKKELIITIKKLENFL